MSHLCIHRRETRFWLAEARSSACFSRAGLIGCGSLFGTKNRRTGWFGRWIGFGVESYPFGLLTMIVSLEAIFPSTFVMISQNGADARRQVIADQQWTTVKEEDKQNVELLDLSRQILALTKGIRSLADR